jgi:hypothetical protein
MRERTPLDTALVETRQAFADLGVVLMAIDHLRTRADRLLPPLLDELRALRPILERAIALLEQDGREGGA